MSKIFFLKFIFISIISFAFADNLSLKENDKNLHTTKIKQIFFESKNAGKICLNVEYASTEKERTLGLMYRKSLDANSGMIFVYDTEIVMRFWMRNTLLPLSIAFLDKDGVIIGIYDMKPLSETPVSSIKPALYAIEVNQGWFFQNNILEGSKVDLANIK